MRIAFLGATRRGIRCLETLIQIVPEATLDVFSFREDPWEPPFLDDMRALTLQHGGTFHESRNVGADRWRPFWASTPVDLLLAVNWRYLIPEHVTSRLRRGGYVFHDSLLPAYRGFSPTVWAMINGEDHTGVTVFQIAADIDSGPIVAQQAVPIGPEATIAEVTEDVTRAYLELLKRHLPSLLDGTATLTPQDHSRATYTCKRLPDDNIIDWRQPTTVLHNLIRAVTRPYSGAFTWLDGARLTVWGARRLSDERPYVGRVPGRVVEVRRGEGTVVLTGGGALLLTEVQREGEPAVPADALLDRLSITLGHRW